MLYYPYFISKENEAPEFNVTCQNRIHNCAVFPYPFCCSDWIFGMERYVQKKRGQGNEKVENGSHCQLNVTGTVLVDTHRLSKFSCCILHMSQELLMRKIRNYCIPRAYTGMPQKRQKLFSNCLKSSQLMHLCVCVCMFSFNLKIKTIITQNHKPTIKFSDLVNE